MRRALHEADILHEGADAALYRVKKNGRGGIWPTADRPVLSVIGPGADEIERRSAGALAFTPSA